MNVNYFDLGKKLTFQLEYKINIISLHKKNIWTFL